MAALAESRAELVALVDLAPWQLDPTLDEAIRAWDRRLHWDFRSTAELVRNYVQMRALEGLALISAGEVAGYCYWVHEGAKALLGDLYVRDSWRNAAAENILLEGAIRSLRASRLPGVGSRIEAQLMQIGTRASALLPDGPRPRAFPRLFMLRPGGGPLPAARTRLSGLRFTHWDMRWRDAAAVLIANVYRNHVDSLINDQYCSPQGAARFLLNIVQYPGCGTFLPAASQIAVDAEGALAGLLLATRVAPRTGHIAQLCLRSDWIGSGLGCELLRRSLTTLADIGLDEASLTVTEENDRAIRLYERTGFHAIHRFDALVWETG